MTLTPGTGRPATPDILNRGLFFRLATDPVVRVWSGGRNIRMDANDLDPGRELYLGAAVLRDIPDIDRLINGQARRVTIALNGLPLDVASMVDAEMAVVEYAHARIGHMRFDRRWQPTGQIRWVFDGILDEIGLDQAQAGDGQEWTLSISLSSALVDRNRPALDFWTPPHQAVISPTDRGLDYVPDYNVGTTRLYPPR